MELVSQEGGFRGTRSPSVAEGEEMAEAEEEAGAGDEEDMGVRAWKRCHQATRGLPESLTGEATNYSSVLHTCVNRF